MRARALPITAAVLLLLLTMIPNTAHSSGGNVAILSVTPSQIHPPSSGNSFSANVTLYIPPGESVGSYDIILKTVTLSGGCNPACPLSITGIRPGNIFPAGQYIEASNCVNGHGLGCGPNDGGGVAHSAEAELSGQSVAGGFTGLNVTVFTVQFQILSTGSVQLALQNDTLVNGENAAQDLPHTTEDGLFSNSGLTALFNVLTAIPIVNRPVIFDASPTFNSTNTTPNYRSTLNYSWDFGDGQTKQGVGLNSTSHVFAALGSYDVRLQVTDEYLATSSFERTLTLASALGTIVVGIVDQTGSVADWNITVSLYNGSTLVQTVTRNPTTNPIIFSGLSEGTYVLRFSGPGVTPHEIGETVTAGWRTVDSVLLTIQYPSPPSYPDLTGIELAVILGVMGIGAVLGTIALRRRRASKRTKPKRK